MNLVLCDVGPRDGLQNEGVVLAPAVRAELCDRLAGCGVRSVEAVSMVRDDRVPQMAGAEDVLDAITDSDAACFSALVLNARGMTRATAAGVPEIHLAVMATEAFAEANTGMSVDAALDQARTIFADARAAGVRVVATVSVAFGCPFEGPVPPDVALRVAERLLEAGADTLFLADTIGVATPSRVAHLVREVSTLGARAVGVHLHDTRNTGMANAMAALESGATSFETSVGGLGGCPFAPGATGNLATEDLVYLLEGEGIATGIDLDGLIEVSHWLEGLLQRRAPAALVAAGSWPARGQARPPASSR